MQHNSVATQCLKQAKRETISFTHDLYVTVIKVTGSDSTTSQQHLQHSCNTFMTIQKVGIAAKSLFQI